MEEIESLNTQVKELEKSNSELKYKNKETHFKLDSALKASTNQSNHIGNLEDKLEKLEKELKETKEKERRANDTIHKLKTELATEKRDHETDVKDAEEFVKNLNSKIKEQDDEIRDMMKQIDENERDMSDMMENLEEFKEKYYKERKEKKILEEELEYVEKKLVRELRDVKRQIVDDLENPALAANYSSKVALPDMYDNERHSRKVEIII